jgi:hypothetical protein
MGTSAQKFVTVALMSLAVLPAKAAEQPTVLELLNKNRSSQSQSSQAKGGQRIINFPVDRSLGTLSVPYKGIHTPLYPNYYGNRDYLCQAQGRVTMPVGETLELTVGPVCLKNLPLLSTLGPNDIDRFSITGYDRPIVRPDQTVMPHLAGLTGLKELELTLADISGEGLKYIKGLTSLKQLTVQSSNLCNEDLAYLSELKSLETLTLMARKADDAGLQHLTKLKSLKQLFISPNFQGPGLAYLSQLPQLSSLTLVGSKQARNDLIHLKQIQSLRKLEIYYENRPITDAELTAISEIQHLEELNIKGQPKVSESVLTCLEAMTALKRFDIDDFEITDARLKRLKKLKNLDTLKSVSIGDEGLACLTEFPSLKSLSCGLRDDVTDAGISKLGELRSLEELGVSGDKTVTDKVMLQIAKLTNLKDLSIDGNISNEGLGELTKLKSLTGLVIGPNCKKVTIAGLNRLNEIPTLASLEVFNSSQDSAVLDISRLTNLENLQFYRVVIGDEDLASLANLKRLKRLIITYWEGDKKITDSGLRHLADLTSLKWLGISCPGADEMTDDGLAHLANLRKLTMLGVSEGTFTEKGLAHLYGLKGLSSLSINSNYAVSNAAVEQLRKEIPNYLDFKVTP